MSQPLPSHLRVRVGVVLGLSALLALLMAPIEVLTVREGRSGADAAVALAIGVGIPLLGVVAARRLVRRARADPERAARRPTADARRVLGIGKGIALVVLLVVAGAVGHGGVGLAVGWVAFTLVWVLVFSCKK